jgi:hypothetical protein
MEKTRLLLQKLKPLYPQTEKLWKLYQISDFDRRKEIEETIARLIAGKNIQTVDDNIVLPPPTDLQLLAGDYPIGQVMYAERPYSGFGINEHE